MTWVDSLCDLAWRSAWTIAPLLVLIWLMCRSLSLRPATRHGLWVAALAWLVVPLVLAPLPRPALLGLASSIDVEEGDPPTDLAPGVYYESWMEAGRRMDAGGGEAPAGDDSSSTTSEEPEISRAESDRARADEPSIANVAGRADSSPVRAAGRIEANRVSGGTAESGRAARAPAGETVAELASDAPARARPTAPLPPRPGLSHFERGMPPGGEPRAGSPRHRDGGGPAESRDATIRSGVVSARAPVEEYNSSAHPNENTYHKSPLKNPRETGVHRASSEEIAAEGGCGPISPQTHGRGDGEWSAWVVAVGGLLQSWRQLPTIPATLWLSGSAALSLLLLARVVWFSRKARAAQAAPKWVEREVSRIGRRIGLRRVPRVLMTEERVSPLVWCGGAPRLLLPRKLWEELDTAGRRAILCHELAHVRRRDHWVCWANLVVAAVYWWNPLAWWLRRRIDEEADHSCDAWVTWLMPRERRAYAQALLRTREYIDGGSRTPAAIAVMGKDARKLSRRLTMVMTQRMRPGYSWAGGMLMAAVIVGGLAAAPTRSCPPEEREAAQAAKAAAEAAVAAETTAAAVRDAELFTTRAEQEKGAAKSVARNLMAAQRAAEERAAVTRSAGGGRGGSSAPRAAQNTFDTFVRGGGAGGGKGAVAGDDAIEIRSYAVPNKKKLDLLYKLMARDDVTIRVSRSDGALVVHATSAQHERMAAFVDLLNGEWSQREYALSKGKLDDLAALLSLDEVPLLVYPGGMKLGVRATQREHEVVGAFVRLIEPDAKVPAGAAVGRSGPSVAAAPSPFGGGAGGGGRTMAAPQAMAEWRRQAEQQAQAPLMAKIRRGGRDPVAALIAPGQADQNVREHAARVRAMTEKLRAQGSAREQMGEQLRERAEKLAAEADRLREAAEELRQKLDGLRERIQELKDSELRGEVDSEASSLADVAKAMEQRAEEMRLRSEQSEQEADAAASDADTLDSQAEELSSVLERLSELSAENPLAYVTFDSFPRMNWIEHTPATPAAPEAEVEGAEVDDGDEDWDCEESGAATGGLSSGLRHLMSNLRGSLSGATAPVGIAPRTPAPAAPPSPIAAPERVAPVSTLAPQPTPPAAPTAGPR